MKRLLFTIAVLCLYQFAAAQFCIPDYTAGTTDDDYINGFSLNTIVNPDNGPGDGSGYTDYSAMSTTLFGGEEYEVYIENTPSFGENYRVYIDYNMDMVFSSSEEITTVFSLAAGEETTFLFTVPAYAVPGITRLRVRCVYATTDFDACDTETYGEAEDYTIVIAGVDNNIGVNDINTAADACELSSETPVSVSIENFGTEPASDFTVYLQVDGVLIASEFFGATIPAGMEVVYPFAATADLSADGPHNITIWTDLPGDDIALDDTASVVVLNEFTVLTTGFSDNICYDAGTIFPSPVAGGGVWSGTGIIDPLTGELDPSLVGGVGSSAIITYTFEPDAAYTVTEIPHAPAFRTDPVELALGDDATANGINIGFNFTYFDITYSSLFISSNGIVGFGAPSNSYAVQHFPNAADPDNIIAWCWADLNPGAGGDISYETVGIAPNRKFIVYYDEVQHYGGSETVTGQLILYETTNAIDMVAIDIQSDGGDMTQGIENQNGTIAFAASELYNQEPFDMSATTWRYAPTPCAGSVTDTIYFIEPPVVVIEDVSVCTGTPVTLDAGAGAAYYVWSTGASTQIIDVVESGTYSVLFYANDVCYSSDSAMVTIHPVPAVDLGVDGMACEGTMLDAENPGSNYLWNTGDISQTIFVTESGTYSVAVDDPVTGCSNADTITMEIVPLPDASFTSTVLDGLTIVFENTSIGAETLLWDFGDGTTSTEENPWHTYPDAGDYTVNLIITNDCGADLHTEVLSATTNISQPDGSTTLTVFPNPADAVISLSVSPTAQRVQIYTVTGELVMHVAYSGAIDVSDLAAGVYTVQVQIKDKLYSCVFIRE